MRPLLLSASCWLAVASSAGAQVYVRAPFVRVQTGPGVAVHAPFVDVFVPPPGPFYVVPPPSIYIPPRPVVVPQVQVVPVVPAPTIVQPVPAPTIVQPVPVQPVQGATLQQFAASFKPRGGTFDVELLNPLTGQPTRVRFTLPAGTPKRVIVETDEVEFRYGLFHFVRIEFTRSGARVVTRMGR